MADEMTWVYASQVTLEASGSAITDTSFGVADDADLTSTNHDDYPYADFELEAAFGSATDVGGVVYLYRQDLNIDGSTNDAPAPASTYPHKQVGLFNIPDSSTTLGYYPCSGVVHLSADCQFSLKNAAGQTLSAGWKLKATPKTYVPAT